VARRPHHLTLPRGFHDVTPAEAQTRISLQAEWLDLCSSHGYQPTILPPVGYASTFAEGHHAGENRTYEFTDRNDRRLALASDSPSTPSAASRSPSAASASNTRPPPYGC
jgi:histidyl-tRNA synthetase